MKNKTHKIINITLIVLLIAGISIPALFTAVQMGCFSSDPQVDLKIEATGEDAPVLRIATDYDFCPNSYYNSDGKLSGLYIELITEASNRLGMRPVFKTADWMSCRKMLEDDSVDVLLGLEIFSNMEGTLRTIPFCSDELCVYGKTKIDSAAALAGKKVALMARSVIETTYDLQCEYVEYSTNTEILQAVENGDVDYGICHGAVATKIMEKHKFHLKSGLVIAKSYPALAVREDHPELRDELNRVLQEMSLDGTIGKMQNKWITEFTRNRSLLYVLKENMIFYVTFLVGVIVLLCITLEFRFNTTRQEEYIEKLLEYQEKLKLSNAEAEQANRAKGEFLSHMSHDIRTPLNGIMGMVEIIKRSRDNPERVEDSLEKIDMASQHLLSLINDVLDMSKFGSEGVELEEVPIRLDEEMEKVHAIVDVQARDKQIAFSIHMDDVVHKQLLGSPAHLRRILLNLISNALRYNRPGGSIDVIIKEVTFDETTAMFELQVADTGIGMSREFLEKRLFKPFTQENSDARTNYQGTGLGMSIVYELVKRMQGTIDVESEQGKGTTFLVNLPFKIDPDAAVKEEKERPACDVSGMKVLVAEDNQLNLEIVEFILEEAGVAVTAVQDGEKAVAAYVNAAEGAYDAILMDVMMPVMDGIEAARKIRQMKRKDAAQIPIIAMTANAFNEDRKKTKQAGMNEHLTKPIDADALLATLARYYR